MLEAGRAESLLTPGDDGRLGVTRTVGPFSGSTGASVAWVLIEGGHGRLTAGSDTVDARGRDDVFDAPGWSAIVGRHSRFALDGGDELKATIVWCASDREVPTEVIDPAAVPDEARGEGTTARRVRTYVPEGPLIVGETLNPPGGWSSWPPHRHEHEEAYLYRFEPAHGFGVHVGYDDDGDTPVIVRDGDIERITTGWHPVVAAPGFTMYYLWALAGDTDTLDTKLDPRFA